jgi:hypothetical protein
VPFPLRGVEDPERTYSLTVFGVPLDMVKVIFAPEAKEDVLLLISAIEVWFIIMLSPITGAKVAVKLCVLEAAEYSFVS